MVLFGYTIVLNLRSMLSILSALRLHSKMLVLSACKALFNIQAPTSPFGCPVKDSNH